MVSSKSPLVNSGNKVFVDAILDHSFSFGLKDDSNRHIDNKNSDLEEIFENKVKQFNQCERSEFLHAIKELKAYRIINSADGYMLARNAEMKIDKLLSDKMQCEKEHGFFEVICNGLKSIGNIFGRISSTDIIDEFKLLNAPSKRSEGNVSIKEAASAVGYLKNYINEIKDADRLDGDKYGEMFKYIDTVRTYLLQEKDIIHDREARRLFNTLMNICLLMPLSDRGTGGDLKEAIRQRISDECDCIFGDFDAAMDGFKERLEKFGNLQAEAVKPAFSARVQENDITLMHRKIRERKHLLTNDEALTNYKARDEEYSQHVKQQIRYLNAVETKYTHLDELHEGLISKHINFIDSVKKYRRKVQKDSKFSNDQLVIKRFTELKNAINEYRELSVKNDNANAIETLSNNADVLLKNFKDCRRHDLDTSEEQSKVALNILKNTRNHYNKALQAKRSEMKEFDASLSSANSLTKRVAKGFEVLHLIDSSENFNAFMDGGLPSLKQNRVTEARNKRKLALEKKQAALEKAAAKKALKVEPELLDERPVNNGKLSLSSQVVDLINEGVINNTNTDGGSILINMNGDTTDDETDSGSG